jgi:hypothetical protein
MWWLLLFGIPGLFAIICRSVWDSGKNDIGMAVLGMTKSGKTLWYNFLQGKEMTTYYTTNIQDVDAFK